MKKLKIFATITAFVMALSSGGLMARANDKTTYTGQNAASKKLYENPEDIYKTYPAKSEKEAQAAKVDSLSVETSNSNCLTIFNFADTKTVKAELLTLNKELLATYEFNVSTADSGKIAITIKNKDIQSTWNQGQVYNKKNRLIASYDSNVTPYHTVLMITLPQKRYKNIEITLNGAATELNDFNAERLEATMNGSSLLVGETNKFDSMKLNNNGSNMTIDNSYTKKYQVDNNGANFSLTADTLNADITLNNNGANALITFKNDPQNISLSASNSVGKVALPSSWSTVEKDNGNWGMNQSYKYKKGAGDYNVSISNNAGNFEIKTGK